MPQNYEVTGILLNMVNSTEGPTRPEVSAFPTLCYGGEGISRVI